MKKVIGKPSKCEFVQTCDICGTRYTYQMQDTFVRLRDLYDGFVYGDDIERSVKCPVCGSRDFATFELYKEEGETK